MLNDIQITSDYMSRWVVLATFSDVYIYIYNQGVDVVEGAGRKAKRMVLQCINGVGSNPVEERTKI
jgi:hypothetical protein